MGKKLNPAKWQVRENAVKFFCTRYRKSNIDGRRHQFHMMTEIGNDISNENSICYNLECHIIYTSIGKEK